MKKNILFIFILLATFSCGEKTAENSKYKVQISELNTILQEVEYKIYDFKEHNLESLVSIKNTAEEKYKKVKEVYVSEVIDEKYEEIMLTYRGKMIKGLRGIEARQSGITKEFDILKKQINDLNDNLIHESFNDELSNKYYNSEKNALFELDRNVDAYNNFVSSVFEINESINLKIDSIITAHE